MIEPVTLNAEQTRCLSRCVEEYLNAEHAGVASGTEVTEVSRYVQAQGPDLFRVFYTYENYLGRDVSSSDFFTFRLGPCWIEDFYRA